MPFQSKKKSTTIPVADAVRNIFRVYPALWIYREVWTQIWQIFKINVILSTPSWSGVGDINLTVKYEHEMKFQAN